jgi:hypothetical protein
MEEASLSSYRPVIVHAWFLATDRALGALVRLRGYAGQSKARIGMSSYFFSRCLFYEYWEDRVFSSCSTLGAGSRSRERKTIKAGRDLAVAWILLLLLLVVPRRRFGFMYLPCCEGTPVPHLAAGYSSLPEQPQARRHPPVCPQCPQSRRPRRPQLDPDCKQHRRHRQQSIIHHH